MFPTSGIHYLCKKSLAALYAYTHLSPLAPKPRYTRLTYLRLLPSPVIMPTLSWPIPRATAFLPTYLSRTFNLRCASHGVPPGAPVQLCPYITHSACRPEPRRKTRQGYSAARVHAKAPLQRPQPHLPHPPTQTCHDHEPHRATAPSAYRCPPRGSGRSRQTCPRACTRRSRRRACPPTTS